MNGFEDQLPREFGKYHLIERVAVGGMAELFRAKLYGAGGFEKDLAVKKILPNLGTDQDFVQMFMDEAMITVTLNHGNIAQVIDFGEIAGEYFLVMEYVDGVDLQSLIKRSSDDYEPIPTAFSAHIVQEICRGLDYAHNKLGQDGKPLNIVHRDVSPQNVLLSFEGQVKLVDFGIARAASRITSTQAGVVKGKVAYMSPEQLMGQPVDGRADVWAAGIILYELLTHQRPFDGATPQETMAAITRGAFKAPQKLNRQVNRKLAAVVKKALERNVKKRYKSAGNMASALAGYLHSMGDPPNPLELAKLIRERMPEAKPRTVQPTPIRRIRQEPTPQGPAGPVAAGQPGSLSVTQQRAAAQPGPSAPPAGSTPPTASAPPDESAPPAESTPGERPRKTTAPNFPEVGPKGQAGQEVEVSEDQPVVVGADGEAISFGALGLPEDYAVSKAKADATGADDAELPEDQRTTEPELPKSPPDLSALPDEEASYEDDEPTVVQPPRFAKDAEGDAHLASAPDDADPELLQAASKLMTQTDMVAATPEADATPTPEPPGQAPAPAGEAAPEPEPEPEPKPAPVPSEPAAAEPNSPVAASEAEIDDAVGELGSYEDELLAAPTRLLDASVADAAPAPEEPAKPAEPAEPVETSDQMDAWMESGEQAEPPADFEDEAPRRPPRKGAGLYIALGVIALLGAGAAIFLVLDPLHLLGTAEGSGPTDMQPMGPSDAPNDTPAGAPADAPTDSGGQDLAAAQAGTGPTPPADVVPDAGAVEEEALDAGSNEEPELAAATPKEASPKAGAGPEDAPPAADRASGDAADTPPKAKPDRKPPKRKRRVKRRRKKADRKPDRKPDHKPDRRPGREVALVKGEGTLRINSEPFAVVYWGNRRIGPTPQMNIKLPAGSHTLTLKNEALGLSKKVRVRIEPKKVHTVFVELKQ